MKIIIWLWNPWTQYKNTRHNVWFLFLDFFARKNNFSEFKEDKKFFWEISEWIIWGEKFILLKPQTFMNLSWKSVQAILNFYKIDFKDWWDDFFVIYDDKDLDFWKTRFREKWSAWGHNWIKDILRILWFEKDWKFKRVKIWVKDEEKLKLFWTSDFVLWNFSNEEKKNLEDKIFFEVEEKIFDNL